MNLLHKIKEIAEQNPNQAAVSSNESTITYRELWEYSDALAGLLKEKYGEDQTPIVVYGHKTPAMIVCFLACVKAGHAYCPVDISVPISRVEAIIEAVMPPVVLAVEALETKYASKMTQLEIEESFQRKVVDKQVLTYVKAEETYYIIFTSGSTGNPKGVEITYDCLNHYVDWSITLGTTAQEKVGKVFINQAPFSFDLSVMDLYTSLASGGTLWTLDKHTQGDYAALFASLQRSKGSVWVSTPSFADICLVDPAFTEKLLPELEVFLFCGETLTNRTAGKLLERFPQCKVVNTYGPTESTVAMTEVVITKELNQAKSPLPVGAVKPGTYVEIRKEGQALAEEGEHGEIIIIGDTVSTGYFRAPALTKKAFFTTTKEGKTYRAYHTGDEGYLEDGMLYYCGRMDLQVKLNGYRIEIEDVENNILKLPKIQKVVVLPKMKEGKTKHLQAFVVYEEKVEKTFETSQEIKKQLKEFLPSYMVPKKFIFLEEIPMTANGKVDRKYIGGLA